MVNRTRAQRCVLFNAFTVEAQIRREFYKNDYTHMFQYYCYVISCLAHNRPFPHAISETENKAVN